MAQMHTQNRNRKPRGGEAFLNNPVLVQAVGLTPVVLAATTLRAALWVALLGAVHLILCECMAAAWLRKLPDWLRIAVYCAAGMVIVFPAAFWLELRNPAELTTLRMVLPIMAFSALVAVRCERFAITHSLRDSLRDAVSNSVGYTVVIVLVGFIRELMGQGMILGRQVSSVLHVRAFWMPFGGFLLIGAMAAALKIMLRFLASRGIAVGVEEAMELAPEDRVERLEKHRLLLQAEEEPIEVPEPPEEAPAAGPAPEEEEPPARPKPIPVERIIEGYDPLEEEPERQPRPLTPEQKERLNRELEELLEDFKQSGA